MLKQIDGKWALVSKKTHRPLAYYRGEGKPSEEWVHKQEARVQFFKHGGMSEELFEASYKGNVGIIELVKFNKIATQKQKSELEKYKKSNNMKAFWELISKVTGVKLHRSVYEEKKSPHPDILPKSGAGQDGTAELVNTYMRDTPGQGGKLKRFKDYRK